MPLPISAFLIPNIGNYFWKIADYAITFNSNRQLQIQIADIG